MPFEQKYDTATREAATARVLERRATHPDDRHVFTVVANEFNVGLQSLRAWVAAASPDDAPAVRKARRPRFSPVVTTRIEPDDEGVETPEVETPEVEAPVEAPVEADIAETVAVETDAAGRDSVEEPFTPRTEPEDMWFESDVLPPAPRAQAPAEVGEPAQVAGPAPAAEPTAPTSLPRPAASADEAASPDEIATLQAEIATLRRRNAALKAAMRILMAD